MFCSLSSIQGQQVFEKVAMDVCKCLDTSLSHDEIRAQMPTCISATFEKNFNELAAVESFVDSTQVYNLMIRETMPLLMNCKNAQVLFNQIIGAKDQTRQITESECKGYRFGNFQMVGDSTMSRIVRKRKSEEVFAANGGLCGKSQVVWLNDCDYQIIVLESHDEKWFNVGDTGIYKLIEVVHDTLRYEFTYKNMSVDVLYRKVD